MGPPAAPYPPALLGRIAALCEAHPGRETCGLVVRVAGALEALEVPNASDRPRTSYVMDPDALLVAFERLARAGGDVVAVWHSHVEAPALFSARDRADALLDGEPALPGAEYLVVSVRGGRAVETRRYVLAGPDFMEAPLT